MAVQQVHLVKVVQALVLVLLMAQDLVVVVATTVVVAVLLADLVDLAVAVHLIPVV